MTKQRHDDEQALSNACSSVATVIALNKPIYPLYVWWLAPDALKASLFTVISLPLYLGLIYLARHNSKASRIGLALIGTLDTLAIGMILGDQSGSWLFLAPCVMLAAVVFRSDEIWMRRIAISLAYSLFALSFGRFPEPLIAYSVESAATLFKLNAFGAFALVAFIGLRFPSGSCISTK